MRVLFRRTNGFVVTSKHAIGGRHMRSVVPPLVAIFVLAGSIAYGLAAAPSDSSLTNATFASIWIAVLVAGTWSAVFVGRKPARHGPRQQTVPVRAPATTGDVALKDFATTVSSAAFLGAALPSAAVPIPRSVAISGTIPDRRPGPVNNGWTTQPARCHV